MLNKLGLAITAILTDLKGLRANVSELQGVPAPKDGKPGTSPDPQAIADLVLASIPAPKDGEPGKDAEVDVDAIIESVLAQIPTPKDGEPGRDAQPHLLADVAALVFAKIEKPKDGEPGKSIKGDPGVSPKAEEVAALVKVPAAIPGPKGKPGVSVTKVKLEKGNKLAIWLDGVRRVVGVIEIPKPAAAFTPGGGGSRRGAPSATIGYTPQGSFFSLAIQEGVTDAPKTILFGAGGSTDGGHATVGADGVFTMNTAGYWSIKQRFRAGRSGASQSSEMFFWAEVSTDGGSNWTVLGNSVDISLDNETDNVVFFDISNVFLPAGVKLRNRFARSSTGHDSGDLREGTPSAVLGAVGVLPAPSAQVTFYRIDQ